MYLCTYVRVRKKRAETVTMLLRRTDDITKIVLTLIDYLLNYPNNQLDICGADNSDTNYFYSARQALQGGAFGVMADFTKFYFIYTFQEIIGELVKMELLEWVVVLKKHLDHVLVNIA